MVTVQKQDGQLQVQVRDNGSGISPEHLPLVFDRFYKLDRGRDRSGTGLGLAIAKAVVEAHGGEITALSSGPGQGSTFTLSLPL